MSDYQKKTIVIKEAKESDDGTRVYIKDQDGITYSFFKEFQGVAQDVYLQWQSGNHGNRYAIGDAATISYKEKPNPKGGVFRNMYSIFPSAGVPVPSQPNTAPQAKSPARGQNLKPSEDVDWNEIAVGKCQTAFLAAFLQAGNTFADTKLQVTQARKLAELVVYGQQLPQRDPIPEQSDDPTNGELNEMYQDEP